MVATPIHQYDEHYLNKQVKVAYIIPLILFLVGSVLLAKTIIFGGILVFGTLLYLILTIIPARRKQARIEYILHTPLPRALWRSQDLAGLHLTAPQQTLLEDALKDFFILHVLAPNKPLAMPSQQVDKLWHAFILDTRRYQDYCQKAFGKVFHHVPDYQFSDRGRNIEMFTWQLACRIQGIRPANPLTLPRLFAADKLLAGAVLGSFLWDSYQTQMALMYRHWHAQTFSRSSDALGDSVSDIGTFYDDTCNVGLTDSGDCRCGGSGSDSGGDGGGDSSCGGGCGGGGD